MFNNFENSFSIKIYRKKLNDIDKKNIEKEIENCSKDIYSSDFMKKNVFAEKNLPSINQPLFSDPEFKQNFIEEENIFTLKQQILNCANEYLKEYNSLISPSSLKLKTSSFVYCFENNWGHLHNHARCKIAGVYYYKTTSLSGKLRLHSPLQFIENFNNNYIDIDPEEGSIVLFPGWMWHEILPNKCKETRISIGFNLI